MQFFKKQVIRNKPVKLERSEIFKHQYGIWLQSKFKMIALNKLQQEFEQWLFDHASHKRKAIVDEHVSSFTFSHIDNTATQEPSFLLDYFVQRLIDSKWQIQRKVTKKRLNKKGEYQLIEKYDMVPKAAFWAKILKKNPKDAIGLVLSIAQDESANITLIHMPFSNTKRNYFKSLASVMEVVLIDISRSHHIALKQL